MRVDLAPLATLSLAGGVHWLCFLIGFPLGDMELLLGELGVAHELVADIVEALDGAYGGGAYGCAAAAVGE